MQARQTAHLPPHTSSTAPARTAPACPKPTSPPYPQANTRTNRYHTVHPFSEQLRCAVSGESYISPSWHGLHCYGASFIPNSSNTGWNEAEEASNRQALAHLNPALAESLFAANPNPKTPRARRHTLRQPRPPPRRRRTRRHCRHAADLRQTCTGQNYRIDTTCPYLPNAYTNTAHGTRGLATAPICAAAVAAEILGLPHLFSQRLRHALHPNRTVIRAIVRRQNLIP